MGNQISGLKPNEKNETSENYSKSTSTDSSDLVSALTGVNVNSTTKPPPYSSSPATDPVQRLASINVSEFGAESSQVLTHKSG